MSRAIVLLSAGLDSVVSFKLACDSYDSIKCLTFDYGQKARSKEIEFASKNMRDVPREPSRHRIAVV